ncbi:hypothetical protein ACF0H5_011075 [Mactra antiquata]
METGVSVGASCFTLVAISLERYFAICRPLRSRRWQTLSHAYKIIGLCWALALVIVIPIAISTQYVDIRPGVSRCRENWWNEDLEKIYTVFLDIILLLVPLCLMTGAYTRIMATLCTGLQMDETNDTNKNKGNTSKASLFVRLGSKSSTFTSLIKNDRGERNYLSIQMNEMTTPCSSVESTPRRTYDQTCIIRQSNQERSRQAKLRVVRMLFVLVVEFFVCWAPLYTVQTWKSFHPESIRENISTSIWSLMFVMSYLSSCVNPITYCFMNKRFRQAFVTAIKKCFCCGQSDTKYFNGTSTRRLTWADTQKDETELSSGDKPRNGML